jgi:hypothetical protein
MSDAAESAHVRLLLADYANIDSQGKINVIGGGVTAVGINEIGGTTVPHAIIAVVTFDTRFIGEAPAVELSLEHDDGTLVELPGPAGVPQFLRVGQADHLKPLLVPGLRIPNDAVRPHVQFVMFFSNGLPLSAGHSYTWRVRVDHQTRDEWTEKFYIPDAAPGPVLG